MKLRCEIVVAQLLPALRSVMTKELLDTYGLTQKKVADLLGITQPAVSQYKRESRGAKARMVERSPELMKMINSLIEDLIQHGHTSKQLHSYFCGICKKAVDTNFIQKLDSSSYDYLVSDNCPMEFAS